MMKIQALRLRISVLCVVLSFALARTVSAQTGTPTPLPTTRVVTSLESFGPGTLNQTVEDANANDTITFDPSLSGTIKTEVTIRPYKNLTVVGPASGNVIVTGYGFDVQTFRLELVNLRLRNPITVGDGMLVISKCQCDGTNVGVQSGTVNISESTFTRAQTAFGVSGGSVTVTDSTFFNNRIAFDVHGNTDASVTIIRSTFDNNILSIITSKNVKVSSSTFNRQKRDEMESTFSIYGTGSLTLKNSIIVMKEDTMIPGNPDYRKMCDADVIGSVIDGGGNIQFPRATCGQNILVADPKLGPLQNNGGSTPTMALLSGSPAIGHGDAMICNSKPINGRDQRGYLIALPGQSVASCDSGAYQTSTVQTAN